MHISKDEVCRIISDEANVPAESLKEDAQLGALGIASLDMISVSFILEDKFGVVLDVDGLTEQSTVGDLVSQVQALAASKVSP